MIDTIIKNPKGVRVDELCEMVIVTNERGLHARAAAKFVQTAANHNAEIHVMMGDMRVDGSSIMGLMMLAASKGSCIKICTSGDGAVDAINDLTDLIRRGFDEN